MLWLRTYLLILELNQIPIVPENLIPMIRAIVEQLRQRKPLSSHLVAIIRIHELVIIHTVWRISLDSLDRRLAAVECNDVVYQCLASR